MSRAAAPLQRARDGEHRRTGGPAPDLVAFGHARGRGALAVTGRVAGAKPGLRGAQARVRDRQDPRPRGQHGPDLAGAPTPSPPGPARAPATPGSAVPRAAAPPPSARPA